MKLRNNFTPKFTQDDLVRANAQWGANCGPGALAAIMDMTLDEVRPHIRCFEERRYTNPSMMFGALASIGRPWKRAEPRWPLHGLVRIQWEGPWCNPGVPARAAYRNTHWVGAAMFPGRGVAIFDVNALANGSGWIAVSNWDRIVVPEILRECVPRANGTWHITHAVEVEYGGRA